MEVQQESAKMQALIWQKLWRCGHFCRGTEELIRKKSLILRWKTNVMVMKRLFLLWLLLPVALCGWGQTYVVRMETNRGVIRMELSDLTPLHRDNFVKNVR